MFYVDSGDPEVENGSPTAKPATQTQKYTITSAELLEAWLALTIGL